MYKSQFRKMDPYGFVVQGHILCLIYQNIISAFVTASEFVNAFVNAFMSVCNTSMPLQMKLLHFLCIRKMHFVDTDLICLVTDQMFYYFN